MNQALEIQAFSETTGWLLGKMVSPIHTNPARTTHVTGCFQSAGPVFSRQPTRTGQQQQGEQHRLGRHVPPHRRQSQFTQVDGQRHQGQHHAHVEVQPCKGPVGQQGGHRQDQHVGNIHPPSGRRQKQHRGSGQPADRGGVQLGTAEEESGVGRLGALQGLPGEHAQEGRTHGDDGGHDDNQQRTGLAFLSAALA